MAAEPKKRKPQTPEGQALVQAMVTNKKLVAETNEAFDRARAGEQGIRWEDVNGSLMPVDVLRLISSACRRLFVRIASAGRYETFPLA